MSDRVVLEYAFQGRSSEIFLLEAGDRPDGRPYLDIFVPGTMPVAQAVSDFSKFNDATLMLNGKTINFRSLEESLLTRREITFKHDRIPEASGAKDSKED